jgi:preprotein translocase subunit YajC
MRMFRNVTALLVTLMLGLGAMSFIATPAQAKAGSEARVVDEPDPRDRIVAYNAVQLKGTVKQLGADAVTLEPSVGVKVRIQKKACRGCNWKTVKKVKTNKKGVYKTRLFSPIKGVWRWRSYIKPTTQYKAHKGRAWTLYMR